jgi:hypothetical protein
VGKPRRAYKPSPTVDERGFSYLRRRVIGRRPDHIRWTPSKALPWWFGTWEGEQPLTLEQVDALKRMRLDPATVETIEVRREIPESQDEPVMPRVGEWKPVYQFLCPIVGPGKEQGAVRVLGPNGKPRDVRADGWAHEPSTRPFQMAGLFAW